MEKTKSDIRIYFISENNNLTYIPDATISGTTAFPDQITIQRIGDVNKCRELITLTFWLKRIRLFFEKTNKVLEENVIVIDCITELKPDGQIITKLILIEKYLGRYILSAIENKGIKESKPKLKRYIRLR